MEKHEIARLIAEVSQEELQRHVFFLSKDPLPYRKLNFTRPGQTKSTLEEADDYLVAQLGASGYAVEKEPVQVQAFRCDRSRPRHHWYSPPDPSDPWYTAHNLYAKKSGTTHPNEFIYLVSHKDSPSWIDCPGAYDNAVGTSANLELARWLAGIPTRRSVWFLFCNEEHTPWTSVTAAENARDRGDNLVAVFNLDGVGGKPAEDVAAGRHTNVTLYTAPEGERLAELMARVNEEYVIGLDQRPYRREAPGDDDGSFIKAGFPAAVANIGSYPFAEPHYHEPEDTADRVDIPNVRKTAQATLAAVLTLDAA